MLDDPWMPKFGTRAALQDLDATSGIERDPDIAEVVWESAHGPLPVARSRPARRQSRSCSA